MASPSETLYDPRSGDLALRVTDLTIEPEPEKATPTRSNYFTVDWLQESRGTFWADCARHPFETPALVFFVPYQRIMYEPEQPLRGVRVQFHANFLCIETHHEEVGCNGVLFNDVYGIPTVSLDEPHEREVGSLIAQIREELNEAGLAHAEIVLSYLKVLLIRATRLKRLQQPDSSAGPSSRRRPAILNDLRDLIEAHYHRLHAPAEYARKLQVNPKTLGRLVKTHLHKTLTELIRERILRDAKWDLLHTEKPVKRIAHELGFADEHYFSRLFKRATGYSPIFFREFETTIRSEEISSIP